MAQANGASLSFRFRYKTGGLQVRETQDRWEHVSQLVG